jgi:hypothetical protein
MSMSRSYPATDTAITSRSLFDGRKCDGKLEGATMAVSMIRLLLRDF